MSERTKFQMANAASDYQGSALVEACAGIFCMAYRAADQDGLGNTQCEVAAQSAVEAFLETLTR